MSKFVAPALDTEAFTCPHCGVFARQYLNSASGNLRGHNEGHRHIHYPVHSTTCEHCNEFCFWYRDKMIFPVRGNAPSPNADMPEEIRSLYEEAASISTQSPRGAAALLRLAIQKLCVYLGGKGEKINDDIAFLVKQGLPESVQKSLDSVRVIGNYAVHPGQIDTDDPKIVGSLFSLVNLITNYLITMPKQVTEIYDTLPEKAKVQIAKRDGAPPIA